MVPPTAPVPLDGSPTASWRLWRGWAARVALALLTSMALTAGGPAMADAMTSEAEADGRLEQARRVQAATRARLRVMPSRSCGDSRFVSYRRSDGEADVADQWYVASQLWADAALLRAVEAPRSRLSLDSSRGRAADWSARDEYCHLDRGFDFLGQLWDASTGGYYPRANLSGSRVERETRYADDNALAGLALLAAADAAPDRAAARPYLNAAVQEGRFMMSSGLWDNTFGGGFWWNTDRGDTSEGKPAQTNALAALFFGRLYAETEDEDHRAWALRTLFWMDQFLYDHERGLYRWSIRYENPARRSGRPIWSDRYFNYDQGIAIEAQLLAAGLDGSPERIERARDLGRALHRDFWGTRGGYNLQAGVEQVYTSYAAWASLGHLALYDADGDRRWLDLARDNADALARALREDDGGYAYRHYRCVDRRAPGCREGRAEWVVDHTRDTSAQAWLQHLQVALAERLVSVER